MEPCKAYKELLPVMYCYRTEETGKRRNPDGTYDRIFKNELLIDTKSGVIPENEWVSLAYRAVFDNHELPLLSDIEAYVKEHFPWITVRVKLHSLEYLMNGAYRDWEGFPLANNSKMIYNVYHTGGESMNVAVSKWGNSIGIRIPVIITESLGLEAGDHVACELKDGGLFIKKQKSTAQMFEEFYGKPFADITQDDLGPAAEMDWGEDVGGEVY